MSSCPPDPILFRRALLLMVAKRPPAPKQPAIGPQLLDAPAETKTYSLPAASKAAFVNQRVRQARSPPGSKECKKSRRVMEPPEVSPSSPTAPPWATSSFTSASPPRHPASHPYRIPHTQARTVEMPILQRPLTGKFAGDTDRPGCGRSAALKRCDRATAAQRTPAIEA
jgi:hypothetical protein